MAATSLSELEIAKRRQLCPQKWLQKINIRDTPYMPRVAKVRVGAVHGQLSSSGVAHTS